MKPTEKPAGASFACPYERDFRKPHKVGDYTVRILPTVKDKDDKDDKDQDADPRCRAMLTSASGKRITIAYEWALSIDPISGAALGGDGTPDLVLSGYSGGLHCCYVYEIVSLGHTPKVVHTFSDPVPMTFEKQADGTALIRAADGVFDYFLVPHTDAVMPQVILKLNGSDLVDVSSAFRLRLQRFTIRKSSKCVSEAHHADAIDKLRKSNYRKNLYTDQIPTVRRVLTIVLDYVYSGREEKAWQTLDEMWPATDVSRVKSLIGERRHRGMLASLECECRPALVARQVRSEAQARAARRLRPIRA